MFETPESRKAWNDQMRKMGEKEYTDTEFDELHRQNEEMMEHSMGKVQIGLEFTNGKFLPDGAGGSIPTNGGWIRSEDGTWVPKPLI